MGKYIIRRLLSVIPTLIGVTLIIFLFQRIIPGDPAVAMLGEHATEENVARIREQFGLDRPPFLDREALVEGDLAGFFDSQYVRFAKRLIQLDLGRIYSSAHSNCRNTERAIPATRIIFAFYGNCLTDRDSRWHCFCFTQKFRLGWHYHG